MPTINYITTNTELTSVANAIRTKGKTSASLTYPGGFVSAINNIDSSGETGTSIVLSSNSKSITFQRVTATPKWFIVRPRDPINILSNVDYTNAFTITVTYSVATGPVGISVVAVKDSSGLHLGIDPLERITYSYNSYSQQLTITLPSGTDPLFATGEYDIIYGFSE